MNNVAKCAILVLVLILLVVFAGVARSRKNAALEKFRSEQKVTIEEKPIFIPLCREWFEKFERGEKNERVSRLWSALERKDVPDRSSGHSFYGAWKSSSFVRKNSRISRDRI